MKLEKLTHALAKRLAEYVIQEIVKLPHMKWIQKQMESADNVEWFSQLAVYAKEISRLAHDHHGVELTPEQVVACVCNDCGERDPFEFAYSLIQDRRHMARWASTFGGEYS